MTCRQTGARQRDRVIARYGQDCWWCGRETVIVGSRPNKEPIPQDGFTVDHKIPLAKGGDNKIENLRPACYSCNIVKADEIWEDGDRPPPRITIKYEEWERPKLADLWPKL